MNKVIYRELVKDDYSRIKELINEAFGFHEFIEDKNCLDSILNMYLQSCILDSSFSNVAELNNEVIGIILGNSENDKTSLKKFHNTLSMAFSVLKLSVTNKKNKKLIKEFSKIKNTYNEIIQGREKYFQGYIELFIVSKESRGLGVGKNLVNYLFDYMKIMDVKSIYLYSDNRCNYGFYDSQNFKRLNEKEIYLDSMQSKLNVFLYSYNL